MIVGPSRVGGCLDDSKVIKGGWVIIESSRVVGDSRVIKGGWMSG